MKIEKRVFDLPGGITHATMLEISSDTDVVRLAFDRELHDGVVLNGMLIDQGATEQRLGRKAGFDLCGIMPTVRLDQWAFDPAQGLWTAEGIIRSGQYHGYDDYPLPDGFYEALVQTYDAHWRLLQVRVQEGTMMSDLSMVVIGFLMPTIAALGQPRSLSEIATSYRARTDLRNLFDLGNGVSDPRFHLLLRPFLPNTKSQAMALAQGDDIVVERVSALTPEEIDEFKTIIAADDRLSHLKLTTFGTVQHLSIRGPLKPNRIPVVVPVITADQTLAVILAYGRHQDSAGPTIEQIAQIACQEFPGCTAAFFGAAGGDVQFRFKPAGGNCINPDAPFGADRRVPHALVVMSPPI